MPYKFNRIIDSIIIIDFNLYTCIVHDSIDRERLKS